MSRNSKSWSEHWLAQENDDSSTDPSPGTGCLSQAGEALNWAFMGHQKLIIFNKFKVPQTTRLLNCNSWSMTSMTLWVWIVKYLIPFR